MACSKVFKKYDSNLTIGQLFKFKEYRDLHISKLSLFDKLNKALHKYGPYMNHKTFLQYIHNKDNRTWYYYQMGGSADILAERIGILSFRSTKRTT